MVSGTGTTLSRTQQLQYIQYVSTQDCFYAKESQNRYIITPSCLFKNRLPKINFQEAIEYMRPYIESFNTVYNEFAQSFAYE